MTFGVDTETMAAGATRIGVAAERIDEMIDRLRIDVAMLLDAWQGDGADAHRKLHERFEKDVVTINADLRAVQEALQQTHSIYVRQESEQSNDQVAMRNQILA